MLITRTRRISMITCKNTEHCDWLRAVRGRVRIPVEPKGLSFLQNRPDRLWGPRSLILNWWRGTPLSIADVKTERIYTSTSEYAFVAWKAQTILFFCNENNQSQTRQQVIMITYSRDLYFCNFDSLMACSCHSYGVRLG